MVAEPPDQHHGGPGRVGDGKNGLTGPNIAMHSCIYTLYLFMRSLANHKSSQLRSVI